MSEPIQSSHPMYASTHIDQTSIPTQPPTVLPEFSGKGVAPPSSVLTQGLFLGDYTLPPISEIDPEHITQLIQDPTQFNASLLALLATNPYIYKE